MINLRELVKNRLLKEMFSVIPEKAWKVMIIDQNTVAVISAACKTSELKTKNISLIESLEKARQPFPQMAGVYFISPIEESAKFVAEDLDNTRYKEFYVLFSNVAPDNVIKIIGKSKNAKLVKVCSEINLDFLAIESNIFHFRDDLDLYRTFFMTPTDQENYARSCAAKIMTFFLTVKEFPYIRFKKDKSNKIAQMIAENLLKYIDDYKKNFPKAEVTKNQSRACMLIVDRSVDCVSPLLHEFTLQAMSADLLTFEKGNIYYHEDDNGVKKRSVIDEGDTLWVSLREKHISESYEILKGQYNDFQKKSGMARIDKQKTNLKELAAKARTLPQYMEKMNNFSMHLLMHTHLMDIYKKENLPEIAMEEQNMATGVDPTGATPKNQLGEITRLVRKDDVSTLNKIRLIMLFFMTRGASGMLKKENKEKLLDLAKLTPMELNAIENILVIKPPKTFSIGKMVTSFFGSNKNKSNLDFDFALSRYVPAVKELCVDILKGHISEKDYPFVNKPPSNYRIESVSGKIAGNTGKDTSSTTGASSKGKTDVAGGTKKPSRFDEEPQWNVMVKTDSGTSNGKDSSSDDAMSSGAGKPGEYKLFVFVCGGLTYSEMRSCYELKNEYGLDVVFGGTSILTPQKMVDKLSEIKGDDRRKLANDDDDDYA